MLQPRSMVTKDQLKTNLVPQIKSGKPGLPTSQASTHISKYLATWRCLLSAYPCLHPVPFHTRACACAQTTKVSCVPNYLPGKFLKSVLVEEDITIHQFSSLLPNDTQLLILALKSQDIQSYVSHHSGTIYCSCYLILDLILGRRAVISSHLMELISGRNIGKQNWKKPIKGAIYL